MTVFGVEKYLQQIKSFSDVLDGFYKQQVKLTGVANYIWTVFINKSQIYARGRTLRSLNNTVNMSTANTVFLLPFTTHW